MKVHNSEFPSKAPIMPQEGYYINPRLGLTQARVAGLSRPLEKEFADEGLQLSENEIRLANPQTPEDMTTLVYDRIKALSAKTIESTVAKAVKNIGSPGLGSRSQQIQQSFHPFIRRVLTKAEIDALSTDATLAAKIVTVFSTIGRLS